MLESNSRIVRFFQNIKYWFLHRTFKRFDIVKLKTLKPGYHDIDTRMLHACFNLLTQYVECEKPFDFIEWDHDEVHRHVASEIKYLYHWWKEVYPNRYKTEASILKDHEYKRWMEWENVCEEEDKQNLIRLMEIRPYLWT